MSKKVWIAPPPTACSFVRGPSGTQYHRQSGEPTTCSSQEQKHGQAKQMLRLRHRSQLRHWSWRWLRHWSWVRCWNWRWFAPLPRQPRLLPLASLLTEHRLLLLVIPSIASGCLIGLDLFHASLLPRKLVRSARPEASAASWSDCSSRDTWLTGLLPTRTTARAPRIH